MEKIIEVKDLTFSYKNKNKALDKITFSVDEGEVFGFLGPNGSGKSTTQKLCIGIFKNYQGSIKILGKEIKSWKEFTWRDIYLKHSECKEGGERSEY